MSSTMSLINKRNSRGQRIGPCRTPAFTEVQEELAPGKTTLCMYGPRGWDRGSGPSIKNQKNVGFLSNTGPDPLKNHKATKSAFNVGPSSARKRNAI